jgi:nicotinamide-nucleotide amidase
VRLDQAEAVLEPIIGPYRFDAASGSLIEALARELIDAGLSMTVAESCTGGLMAKRITDLPGSSAYFHGGVVAYADRVKVDVLGVDETVLLDDGAVSEAVAVGMARGAAELFRADVAVGVTGVAGPEGGSKEKPVGFVWYAASVQGRVESANKVFSGDREAVREQAAQAAFLLVFRMLTDRL